MTRRRRVKELADNVTAADLKAMFIRAWNSVPEWTSPSRNNKGMSIGTVFNIFTAIDITDNLSIQAKRNMINEFGEYLPDWEPIRKEEKPKIIPTHQSPKRLRDSYYNK